MRGVITPAARGDILSHFRYYTFDQQVPESGARFLDTIESATEQISQNTAIGAPQSLAGFDGSGRSRRRSFRVIAPLAP